jgi:hypothetical protein
MVTRHAAAVTAHAVVKVRIVQISAPGAAHAVQHH